MADTLGRGAIDVRVVSESIAHDGDGFYCRLCGRAGYRSLAAVKGHLSQCPGKLVQKGVLPAEPQVAAAGLGWAGAGNNALLQTASPAAAAPAPGAVVGPALYGMQEITATIRENAHQISRMQNEYTHLMVEKNQRDPDAMGWFSQNKQLIILGLVAVLVVVYLTRQNGSRCENGFEKSDGKGALDKLGEKALGAFTNKAISKSVDSLFR